MDKPSTDALAKANTDTQLDLMKDIIRNDGNILHHVAERGKGLKQLLLDSKRSMSSTDADPVEFKREVWEEMYKIACMLESPTRYGELGILAEQSVPDNVIKKEILVKLQTTI